MAERLASAPEVAVAMVYLAHALVNHTGELKRGLTLHHKGLEIAKERSDSVAFSTQAHRLTSAYVSLLDADEAMHWAEEGEEAANQTGAIYRRLTCSLHLAWASILLGDAPRALSGLETAREAARKVRVDVTRLLITGSMAPALVHFFLGEWDTAEAEAVERLETSRRSHNAATMQGATLVLASISMETGDMASAKTYLLETAIAFETESEMTLEVVPRALLTQVCSKSGELEEAATHLCRAQEILSNGEDWRGLAAEVYLAAAVLASAEKRWEDAEADFGRALEVNRHYHLRYYEARCLMEWGRMRLSRNEPGDGEQGMKTLDRAMYIFQSIQASKMVERVAALKEQIQPAAAPTYPDGLTEREVEVLRLVAGGRSNRQIGEELFIAMNTVARHVSNIFSKTDSSNRAEAATYANRNDLV